MQVTGPESVRDDPLSISTGIVIVGGMKGLMEVAYQMEDELQGYQSFFGISARVGKLGGKLPDLINDASLRRAIRGDRPGWQRRVPEASGVEVRVGKLDIDKVPVAGLLVMLAAAVSI
jgi:hypothetical protein